MSDKEYTTKEFGLIKQLGLQDIVQKGDLVMINDTAEDGFRLLQGLIGDPAGVYKYPIFRSKEFQGIKLTEEKPEVITFCGSSRFVALMAIMMWEFEKLGNICMGLHLLPYDYCEQKGYTPDESGHIHHIGEQEGIEDAMDTLHFKKIDMSDSIYVVNLDGYIGSSTAREIAYAKHLGKRIMYHEKIEIEGT